MTNITNIFIVLVLIPLILGIFGEEIFGYNSDALISLFFIVSIVGSIWIIFTNHKLGFKKTNWYIIASLSIVINLILLFLVASFHPGF